MTVTENAELHKYDRLGLSMFVARPDRRFVSFIRIAQLISNEIDVLWNGAKRV